MSWFRSGVRLAPVAETGFSHRLNAYKIVGHFLGLSCLNISGNNQVENIFLESVTFQFHTRKLSSEAAKSLKSYGHFLTLGSRSLSVTAMLLFSCEANTSIHGLEKDDTASVRPPLEMVDRHWTGLNPCSAGVDFSRQNLTSVDVRF